VKKYLRIAGSLVLLAVLAWRIDWGQLGAALARLDLRAWLAAVALYVFAQGVSALRWQWLARALGLAGTWGQFLTWYFVGMFFNLVLPTSVGGDVVRAWYLSRQTGHAPHPAVRDPHWAALLSVVGERANGLAVLILIGCAAVAFTPRPLPAWISASVGLAGAACVAGLGVLALLPRLRGPLAAFPRFRHLVDGALVYLDRPYLLAGVTALSLVIQLASVALVGLVGLALGLPVPWSYYAVLVPLVNLLTLLPVSVNGMGLREAGMVVLLAPLGVAPAEAVALSLGTFAAMGSASLLGAPLYLMERPVPGRKRPKDPCSEEGPAHAHAFGGHPHQGRDRQPPAAA
jgi:uncharacterized membrane protein YbhN (UPF0104 family)